MADTRLVLLLLASIDVSHHSIADASVMKVVWVCPASNWSANTAAYVSPARVRSRAEDAVI